MSTVKVISDAEFAIEVLQAELPVMVYFWAQWCGPCRLTAPMMDGLATVYADRLKIIKMEVDPNPETVAKYKVEGVPAFRFFQTGELKSASEGAIIKPKLQELIDAHLATC